MILNLDIRSNQMIPKFLLGDEKSAITKLFIEYLSLFLKLLLLTKPPKIGSVETFISWLMTEFKPLSSLKNLGNMYVCHKAIIATQKIKLTPAKPKSKNLKVSIFVF